FKRIVIDAKSFEKTAIFQKRLVCISFEIFRNILQNIAKYIVKYCEIHRQILYIDIYRLLTGKIYIDTKYPCRFLSIVIVINIYLIIRYILITITINRNRQGI